jgi:NADH-quinone oxidoreductase subunit F
MSGRTICVLSDAAAAPITSSIQKFRADYEALMAKAPAMAGMGMTGAEPGPLH